MEKKDFIQVMKHVLTLKSCKIYVIFIEVRIFIQEFKPYGYTIIIVNISVMYLPLNSFQKMQF